jgi:hypothetical protein
VAGHAAYQTFALRHVALQCGPSFDLMRGPNATEEHHMKNRSRGRCATRLVLAGAVAGLACLVSTSTAGAATPPDPLGGVLHDTTDTVSTLLGGATATPPAGLPSGLPALPALPAPPALPALPAPPALPALPGQAPGAAQDAGVTAAVDAPAGDNLAAIDAAVATFLGVCARVPQGVVPVQADIVVLDRNLITELIDAGVPLQPLVVPCPKDAAAPPATPSGPTGPGAAASGSGQSGAAGSALPASLAFTGTDVAPMVLFAGGLLALGVAFQRKARMLAQI